MKKIKLLFVLGALLFAFSGVNAEVKEYELVLEQALKSGTGGKDFPVHVYLRHDGSRFVEGIATSFYLSNTSFAPYEVDVTELPYSYSEEFSGRIQAEIDDYRGGTIVCDITVRETANGFIQGSYTGWCDGEPTNGKIEGTVRDGLNLTEQYNASIVFLELLEADDKGKVTMNLGLDAGAVTEVSISSTPYTSTISTWAGYEEFISPFGLKSSQLSRDVGNEVSLLSHNLTITSDSLTGDVEVDVAGEVFTYEIDALIIAGFIVGRTDVKNSGGTIVSSQHHTAGNIAQVVDVPVSSVSPIVSTTGQPGNTFQPPYFEEISQANFYERIRSASDYNFQSPFIGGFNSDVIACEMKAETSKQYDNAAENIYGGAMGMLMQSRLSDDPYVRGHALRSAQRAGYWGQAVGHGVPYDDPYNFTQTYKGQFYTQVWRGLALIELYLETGKDEWRENSKQFAFMLEDLQLIMWDHIADTTERLFGKNIGGTWTYYGGGDPYFPGVSNSRHDRSHDWYPIQAGEFLYFLGKLRVEGGIDAYKHVEDSAYAWMLANIGPSEGDEPGPGAWHTKNLEALGPSQFLMYMLHYADQKTDKDIDTVLAYVEDNHTIWEHPDHSTDPFTPGMKSRMPRMQDNNGTETEASTTLRMALVYLELYKLRDDPTYKEKAQTLMYSVLNIQNEYGYINYCGKQYPGGDIADNYFAYSALSSETIRLLNECYILFSELGGFGDNALTVQLELDTIQGEAPLEVSFDASGSTGSGLSYLWDFGNGNTSTAVSPSYAFDAPGNYIVRLRVEDENGAVMKKQVTVKVSGTESEEVPQEAIWIENFNYPDGTRSSTEGPGWSILDDDDIMVQDSQLVWNTEGYGSRKTLQSGWFSLDSLYNINWSFWVGGTTSSSSDNYQFILEHKNGVQDTLASDNGSVSDDVFTNGVLPNNTYDSARVIIKGDPRTRYYIFDSISFTGTKKTNYSKVTFNLQNTSGDSLEGIEVEFKGFLETAVSDVDGNVELPKFIDADNFTNYIIAEDTEDGYQTYYGTFAFDGDAQDTTVTIVLLDEAEEQLDQTITFVEVEDPQMTSSFPVDISLTATASSNLTVSYEVVSGDASVSGNTLTVNSEGGVTVKAMQEGNTVYNPAPAVEQTFNVDLMVHINALTDDASSLRVHPNPTSGVVYVGSGEPLHIQVYNTPGSLINECVNCRQVDLTNHQSGLYLLKVNNEVYKVIRE